MPSAPARYVKILSSDTFDHSASTFRLTDPKAGSSYSTQRAASDTTINRIHFPDNPFWAVMQAVHERFRGLLDRNGRAWFCFLVLSRHLGFRLDMLCPTFVLALSLLSVRGCTGTRRRRLCSDEWTGVARWAFSEGMRQEHRPTY